MRDDMYEDIMSEANENWQRLDAVIDRVTKQHMRRRLDKLDEGVVVMDSLTEMFEKIEKHILMEALEMYHRKQEQRDRGDAAMSDGASKFLMKRGLSRDKANLVTLLIRQRSELQSLLRLVSDPNVVQEAVDLSGFMAEQIELMYQLQHEEESEKRS